MPDENQFDPFKPQQPAIPGVPAERPKKHAAPAASKNAFLLIGIAAIVLVGGAIAWWAHGSSAKSAPPVVREAPPEPAPAPPKRVQQLPVGPGLIARADELTKVWSAKRFIYRNLYTGEELPALVVRLPGGSFWGISLREPYGRCDLEYVTDLERLRTQYHFNAEHPMVVDPCGRIVYDLARYSNGPTGLVRGAVVKGTGVRPPFGIEIRTEGKNIVADRIENTR